MHSVQEVKDNLLQEVYSLELDKRDHEKSLVIPCIREWELHTSEESLYIIGKVKYHPRYRNGSGIKTSPILSYRKIQNRLTVMTKHSVYELGKPSDTQIENEALGLNTLDPTSYSPLPDPWDSSGEVDKESTIEL